jgi:EmrB/QacA subfamily drug resistance transporter
MTIETAAPAPTPMPDAEGARPSRATMIVYLGAMTAMFMSVLDMQIIVTALPTIASDFDNLHLFGWVGASYLLATAAVAPFYGKLGDLFGRRNVLLTTIVLFLLGSLACGLAWSMETLIAARILQGIGGGGLMVSAFAVIGELFGPRERAKYQGYTSIVFTAASILGPVAGGWLTETVGWRWVFLVNLPVGIVVLAIIAVGMRPRVNLTRRQIDYLGGALMALAAVSLVYWGDYVLEPGGPTLWTFALPIIGVLAIASFVFVERRAEEPILPLQLFANRTISLLAVISLITGMATLGQFFYYALYMQMVTGLGPALVGMLFLSSTVSSTLTSIVVGGIVARTGHYKWFTVIGMALGAVTMAVTTLIDSATPIVGLVALFFVFGISMGCHFQVVMTAMQAAAPLKDIGAATGIVTQARTLGAGLGLAVNGGVLTWALTQENARVPADLASQIGGGLTDLSLATVDVLSPAARSEALAHYSAGFEILFWWVAGLYAVAFVVAVFLRDVEIPKRAL